LICVEIVDMIVIAVQLVSKHIKMEMVKKLQLNVAKNVIANIVKLKKT
tara:strand:+ start:365 stop:508 length:144 start_codon:yes stop_codon:yes gene_type:complete